MKILLTNDDGIFAKGIEVLHKHLSQDHEVVVVAPETEQSAVGHAITLTDPLLVKSVNRNGIFFGHAVKGTPADCVKLAINELVEQQPDLVVSGINLGANVGINVIYSGTVSAATEGAILGVPSMAISINTFRDADFEPAARFARLLARLVNQFGIPAHTSLPGRDETASEKIVAELLIDVVHDMLEARSAAHRHPQHCVNLCG